MFRLAALFLFVAVFAVTSAVTCSNECKKPKAAKNECRYKGDYCKVVTCKHDYFKKAKACVDHHYKPPHPTHNPHHCSGTCQKKKGAKLECRGKHHCELVKCGDHYSKHFKCVKIGDIKPITKTPTPTPSPSKLPICQTCPKGQYQKPGRYCSCTNKPCDACPDNTVCRKVEDSGYRRQLDVTNMSARAIDLYPGDYICVRCECGYCDASADACCGMKGANCLPTDFAQLQQCKFKNFDLLNDGYPGEPAERNVCYAGEELDLKNAKDLVESCGCIPNAETKCDAVRNKHLTNCRIPRL